jgi:carboxyl-terminal processing protease
MLPDDPTAPSPDAAPESDAATAMDPEAVGSTAPDGPGYVAGPAPVVVASRPSRRGTIVGIALVVVALLGGAALFVSGYSLGVEQSRTAGTPSGDQGQFKAFWDTYYAVRDRFALGPVQTQTLVEGAIKGLVASVNDPYSTYLTPEDYQASLQDISGQFTGIGVTVATIDAAGKTVDCTPLGPNCRFVVVEPLDGSPAAAAGIKAADIIAAIDGKTVDGLTPDEARNQIRGPEGTKVTITISRTGQAPFDVPLTRAKIQRKEVTSKDLANGTVGYVKLAGFESAASDSFVAAVKSDVDKGQKQLVIDLRGNPGGFITDAQKIASVFIASGPVFYEQFADCHQQEWDALGGSVAVATDPSIKVILLVDGGSASAAEIVTGALRDTGRATIVGEKTFGKGTVQEWIPLDQLGAVKLTVAKWLTPAKNWIHKVGITPDVPVTVPSDTPVGQDPVLDKALALLGSGAPAASQGPGPSIPPCDATGGPSPTPGDSTAPSSSGAPSPSSAPSPSGALFGSWLMAA